MLDTVPPKTLKYKQAKCIYDAFKDFNVIAIVF